MLSANQALISVVLGITSLFVSTLNTTGSYFQFAKRAEGHRIAGIQFGKMYRFLAIEMSLPRDERMQPHDLLKMTKETYDRLQEISPPLPDSITAKYRAKFKDAKDIAVPEEANGLERIHIYTERVLAQSPLIIKIPAEDNAVNKVPDRDEKVEGGIQ